MLWHQIHGRDALVLLCVLHTLSLTILILRYGERISFMKWILYLLSVVMSEIDVRPHFSAYIVQSQRCPYGTPDTWSIATSDVSVMVLAEKFRDDLSYIDSRDMTKSSGAIFPPSSCSTNNIIIINMNVLSTTVCLHTIIHKCVYMYILYKFL